MEKFLSDSIQGVDVLSSFKIKTEKRGKKLAVLRDYTKTIPGVSSELFLVRGGGPSSRERMVLSKDVLDVLRDYTNSVSTVAPLSWQVFNDPTLHTYLVDKLKECDLLKKKYFSNDPLPGIGELVSFKYRGGVPQNIIFPIGSSTVNWLCCIKSSRRMGDVLMKRPTETRDANYSRNLRLVEKQLARNKNKKNEEDMKRLRFWRYFYFIEDATERTGMMHHNPFAMSHISFDINMINTLPNIEHDFSLAFTGDCFSRESIILSDIVCGGRTSNYFHLLQAVLKYRFNNNTDPHYHHHHHHHDDNDENENWTDVRKQILAKSGYRLRSADNDVITIDDALERLKHVIKTSNDIHVDKKNVVMEFTSNVLHFSHREILNNITTSPLALKEQVEELLLIIASKQEWILLYSILQQIQFNILHFIGYQAHRILIFKMFVPVLIAVMFTNGSLSQTVAHAAVNLNLSKRQAGQFTMSKILDRSTINLTGVARHFSRFDRSDPEGFVSSTMSVPLVTDIANVVGETLTEDMEKIKFFQNVGMTLVNSKILLSNRKKPPNKRKCKNSESGNKMKKQKLLNQQDSDTLTLNEERGEEINNNNNNDNNTADDYDPEEGCSHWSESERVKRQDKLKRQDKSIIQDENDDANNNNENLYIDDNNNNNESATHQDILSHLLLSSEQEGVNRYDGNKKKRKKMNKKDDNDNTLSPVLIIKGIINLIEQCFGMKPETIFKSIHANTRHHLGEHNDDGGRGRGRCNTNPSSSGDSNSGNWDNESPIDYSDRKDVNKRFLELIIDPPLSSFNAKQIISTEHCLHNEYLLNTLQSNPLFRAIEGTNDPLERMIVLWNIGKYINMVIAGLITVDLASLIDQRKGARKALRRGTVMKQNEFNYREAGNAPGEMRDMIVPHCISKLTCITGKNYKNQNCHHFFCRSLRVLFLTFDPDKATEIFIDKASQNTLLRLRDFCRKKGNASMLDWNENVFIPIANGDGWVSKDINEDKVEENVRRPKDFSWLLKKIVIEKKLLTSTNNLSTTEIENESNKMRPLGYYREPYFTDTENVVAAATTTANTTTASAVVSSSSSTNEEQVGTLEKYEEQQIDMRKKNHDRVSSSSTVMMTPFVNNKNSNNNNNNNMLERALDEANIQSDFIIINDNNDDNDIIRSSMINHNDNGNSNSSSSNILDEVLNSTTIITFPSPDTSDKSSPSPHTFQEDYSSSSSLIMSPTMSNCGDNLSTTNTITPIAATTTTSTATTGATKFMDIMIPSGK